MSHRLTSWERDWLALGRRLRNGSEADFSEVRDIVLELAEAWESVIYRARRIRGFSRAGRGRYDA